MHERFVLPSKPRLFESFSGIGCQRMAFDRLGIEYEMVGISEIDKYAIKSYMAIHGDTKNFGSITDIKGDDLPQIDVFTYSFPCTDLSKAGKQKGLSKTRSGLVYEVLRILHELHKQNRLPKVLIMENVVDLVQTKFIREFQEIQVELESMGYTNYTQTLNAKEYGVAQNRDRVFMVSILGDYYYEFPKPIPLEKRLKDYLESEVDEKYYLSDSFIATMYKDSGKFNRAERFEQSTHKDVEDAIGFTITSRAGGRPTDNFISVPEATDKGYAEAFVGDSVSLEFPNSKTRRGRVGKQIAQTLTCQTELGVVVNEFFSPNVLTPKRTEHGKEVRKKYENGLHEESRHTMTKLTPRDDEISNALTTVQKDNMLLEPSLRIRKLTPLECWRLMGIDDKDFHKASQVCSNAQLYKQAGNGIVVDVFAKIIERMAR